MLTVGDMLTGLKTSEVRNRVLVTLGLLLLYRTGAVFPAPGVDYGAVQQCVSYVSDSSFYSLVNLFGGGALFHLSLFALGAIPYITASIIMQLLGIVVPKFAKLRREGQQGQAQITQYTRYVTVALAVLQAVSITLLAKQPSALFNGCPNVLVVNQTVLVSVVMATAMVAGALLVMWFGEVITERGIGNGMSLIIFASIAASLPSQVLGVFQAHGWTAVAIFVAATVAVIACVVYIEQAQRRIPIHYHTRRVSRREVNASTYLPLKLNMPGVVPIIFASSLMSIPFILVNMTGSQAGWAQWVAKNFTPGVHAWYLVAYVLVLMFFAYFYTTIIFNPFEVAEDLNKDGGFVPGVRPGDPTAYYFAYVLNRLLFPGSLYLAAIAILPLVAFGSAGLGQSFVYSGTSVLILVGVALDTLKQYSARTKQFVYAGVLLHAEDDGIGDVFGDVSAARTVKRGLLRRNKDSRKNVEDEGNEDDTAKTGPADVSAEDGAAGTEKQLDEAKK